MSKLPNRQARPAQRQAPAGKAPKPSRPGARASKTGTGDRVDAWLQHHRSSAVTSALRLWLAPVKSFLTMSMLGIALALPALLYVALANISQLSGQWSSSNQLSVYLHVGATDVAAGALADRLRAKTQIEQVQLVSPDQGLRQFASQSGMGSLLTDLTKNPLPWVLLVQPKAALLASTELEALSAMIGADPVVSDVRIDMAWLERLNQFMQLGQRFALGLGLLLGLGMLLAIGNTLGLAIENRREEILVVKLVGGTDAFVRRPFLYTGMWYGIGGGLCALILIAAGLWLVDAPIANLAQSYQSGFALQGLGAGGSVILLTTASVIGWLGAWLAVGRYLRDIRPQ